VQHLGASSDVPHGLQAHLLWLDHRLIVLGVVLAIIIKAIVVVIVLCIGGPFPTHRRVSECSRPLWPPQPQWDRPLP